MSVRVMASVWASAKGDASELLLLLALADRASDDGVSWPLLAELAKKCRMSERHVIRMLGAMVTDERLQKRQVQRSRRRMNVYRLNMPGMLEVDYERLPFTVNPPFYDMTPRHLDKIRRHDTKNADDMTPRVRASAGLVSDTSNPSGADAPQVGYSKEQRSGIWDALQEATGVIPETIGERSLFGKCVRELLEAGATPEEVTTRARRWPMRYQNATLTARALTLHWGELSGKKAGARLSACPECGEELPPAKLKTHRYDHHDVGTLCPDCGQVVAPEEQHTCKVSGQIFTAPG